MGLCIAMPALAATQLQSTSVLPGLPTTADEVTIRQDLAFNTGGHSLGGSTVTFLDPFDLRIDIYVVGPDPGEIVTQAFVFRTENTNLGTLPVGDYQYTSRVVTIPRSQFPDPLSDEAFLSYPTATRSGQFTVVPEPASLTLLALSGWAFTRRRRYA